MQLEKLEFLSHHLEHQFVTLEDRVAGLHGKVDELENKDRDSEVTCRHHSFLLRLQLSSLCDMCAT